MKIVVTEVKQGVRCISLEGRMDATSAQAGEEEFNTSLTATNNVIVDLEKVTFIGSVGIRLLIAGAKLQRKMGGKMVIADPNVTTRWVIKTTGIDQVIPVFDNIAAALATFA